MIEQETTIIMRCDNCGNVLVDDSEHIIRLDDDRFAYAQLRKRAIDMGWKCEDSCLCLVCRKECAK